MSENHKGQTVCTHTYIQTQEHHYHVLEKDIASHGVEVIPPDPDAPELPPLFKPGSPPPDPPPIYQDITEISTSKTDQQESSDLNTDGDGMSYSVQNEKVQLSI